MTLEDAVGWNPRIMDHGPHYDDPNPRHVAATGIATDPKICTAHKVGVRGPDGKITEYPSIKAAGIALGLYTRNLGRREFEYKLRRHGMELL